MRSYSEIKNFIQRNLSGPFYLANIFMGTRTLLHRDMLLR